MPASEPKERSAQASRSAGRSATLDHDLALGEPQQRGAPGEQDHRPGGLEGEPAQDRRTGAVPEPDVGGDLHEPRPPPRQPPLAGPAWAGPPRDREGPANGPDNAGDVADPGSGGP